MEKDIVDGKIGSVGAYDLEFKGGYLSFVVNAKTEFGVEAGLTVKVGSDAVLDAIKAKIPGSIDDAIIDVMKAALKV